MVSRVNQRLTNMWRDAQAQRPSEKCSLWNYTSIRLVKDQKAGKRQAFGRKCGDPGTFLDSCSWGCWWLGGVEQEQPLRNRGWEFWSVSQAHSSAAGRSLAILKQTRFTHTNFWYILGTHNRDFHHHLQRNTQENAALLWWQWVEGNVKDPPWDLVHAQHAGEAHHGISRSS